MAGSSSSPRTTVVTGGAGFIGSHVADHLLAAGDAVWVVDDLSSGRLERVPEAARFTELDVADLDALRDLVDRDGPFDRWIHLAAQADVRVSVEHPLADARTNVLGTIAVLEAARIDGATVTFVSTGGAIYGDAAIPTPEGTREAPESPYGAAKLAAEHYVQMHARLYGLAHAVVRFANVYGPRQDPHGEAGVVAIFGGKVLAGEAATIYGDGSQTRDYVYVGDAVEATVAAAGAPARADGEVPVYNVGTGVETSVNELWKLMQQAGGVDLGQQYAPARTGELARSALDAALLRRELGVQVDTPLPEGLARTLDWMRTAGG